MECDNCKKIIVMHAFSDGECEICKTKVVTSHIPCNKLCDNCSVKYNRCKACGKEIEKYK